MESSIRSVCLACAKYSASDHHVGKALAYVCFSPYLVLIYIAAAAHSTRDVTAALIGLGALINAALSMAAKKLLRHPRPAATCAALGKCHKFGMPSSHAQVMAFATVIAILMHFHRRKRRAAARNGKTGSDVIEVFELIFLIGLTLVVALARVYLGYHSEAQVAAGIVFGACFAGLWFRVISAVHTTGLVRKLQRLLFPLIELNNRWDRGYIHEVQSTEKDD